jgi:hypothetical protein
VVDQTMQPTQVSLWLRVTARTATHLACSRGGVVDLIRSRRILSDRLEIKRMIKQALGRHEVSENAAIPAQGSPSKRPA